MAAHDKNDTDNPLKDNAPVHLDMGEDQVMPHRSGGGRFVIFTSIIVLTVAGGIYWLVGDSQAQIKQLASSISPEISKKSDLSDTSSTTRGSVFTTSALPALAASSKR